MFSDLQHKSQFISEDKFPPAVSPEFSKVEDYESDLKEMTNEDFLTNFIASLTVERDANAKKNLRGLVGNLVLILLGINILVWGILERASVAIVFGILEIIAYAGLICSVILNLSLGVLIPSSIILGLIVIVSLIAYSCVYKENRNKVELFNSTIYSMNNELTKAKDKQAKIPLDSSKGKDETDNSKQPKEEDITTGDQKLDNINKNKFN